MDLTVEFFSQNIVTQANFEILRFSRQRVLSDTWHDDTCHDACVMSDTWHEDLSHSDTCRMHGM